MAKLTLIIASIISASLLCNIFLSVSPFTNTSSSIPDAYRALAFKPTNKNNTAIPKPPVTVNHPPIANAGPDQTVNENATVTLNGIASDPDLGDKLSYSWKQIAGPAVKLTSINTTNPYFVAPDVSSDRDLKFSLTAKDDKGAPSLPAVVTITVKHTNHPPVANVGVNQTVNPGDIVTLDGSKSRDPDSGDTLNYSWLQTSGPTVKLDGANSPISTFTAPSNISADTTLGFKLTVKDSKNASGTADVKVVDKYIPPPNKPPIANAGPDQTVNAGDRVKLNGIKSRDPDGRIASYLWKQIGGQNIMLNGDNTATPSFTAPTNISATSSGTMLVFELAVNDDRNATSISTVKVTVNPVNHPPISNAGSNQTVNPGDIVTLDGSKSRDPDNDQIRYSWKQIAGPAVTLNGADTATPTFAAPSVPFPLALSQKELKFSLTVKDDKGTASNNPTIVTITVKAAAAQSLPSITTAPSNKSKATVSNEYAFVRKWGGTGTGDGQFDTPEGISVDSSTGNVYVADWNNNRIQKFDNNGKFITKWGSEGSADGQFSLPQDVALDSSGNVYVADKGNNRVQKFDNNGKFITKWGSEGSADGQFTFPYSVAVDSAGYVYVTDDNNRVQKFDSNGKFITKWGSTGTADGQFYYPKDIAVDSSGNVYVTDSANRIQVFAPSITSHNNKYAPLPTSNAAEISIVNGAVYLGNKAFWPDHIKIKVGTTVIWRNDDSNIHTVTSGIPNTANAGEAFDSGLTALIMPTKTYSHKFTNTGEFSYFCRIHPTMVGEIEMVP